MRPGRFTCAATQCLRPFLLARKTFLNAPRAILRFHFFCHHGRVKMRTISHSPPGRIAPTPDIRGARPSRSLFSASRRKVFSPFEKAASNGTPAAVAGTATPPASIFRALPACPNIAKSQRESRAKGGCTSCPLHPITPILHPSNSPATACRSMPKPHWWASDRFVPPPQMPAPQHHDRIVPLFST